MTTDPRRVEHVDYLEDEARIANMISEGGPVTYYDYKDKKYIKKLVSTDENNQPNRLVN